MTSTAQAAQIRANIEAMRQEAIAANPIYDMAPNQIGRHVAHAMRWDGDETADLGPLTQRQIGTILAALGNWRHETDRTDRANHAYATGDESFEPLDDGEIDALIRDITEARA